MKNIKYIIKIMLLLPLIWVGCSEDEHSFGDIIAPSNIEVNFDIVGVNSENPSGDGSGLVNFTVSAKNAISYRIDYGDGKKAVNSSGTFTHRYTKVGKNIFNAVITGIGTAGTMSSIPLQLEVYSSFTDTEAEKMLAGETVGDSKVWYWAANVSGYAGLGPQEADNGNGDFAYPAWWQAAPFDNTRTCMFENSFIFSKTADGITFKQTADYVFVPGAYAGEIGVEGDKCANTDAIPSITGTKKVSFFPSSSKAATEGSFDNKPYRGTAFELSDNGMLGWYVGSSTYDIISVTDTTLIVRVMQPNSQFAWYHIFTTTKPAPASAFTNLVWSDEFDTGTTPDTSKWDYDIGTGTNGWGNSELQSYTNNAENVSIADGILKITAKADGSGGYTSGRIKTQGLYDFKYGKVEVRAKLPAKQGTWPAIWMLGNNISTEGWPKCGEIDIMEQMGGNKENVIAASHWQNSESEHKLYSLSSAIKNASTEFHTYVLEWTQDKITIYVDDVKSYEMDNTSELPFNQNFFLILNLAIGGTLGGDVATDFTEDTFEIDYIRVYQ